jgi:hypothetical protein
MNTASGRGRPPCFSRSRTHCSTRRAVAWGEEGGQRQRSDGEAIGFGRKGVRSMRAVKTGQTLVPALRTCVGSRSNLLTATISLNGSSAGRLPSPAGSMPGNSALGWSEREAGTAVSWRQAACGSHGVPEVAFPRAQAHSAKRRAGPNPKPPTSARRAAGSRQSRPRLPPPARPRAGHAAALSSGRPSLPNRTRAAAPQRPGAGSCCAGGGGVGCWGRGEG